jgi:hypothetical protein
MHRVLYHNRPQQQIQPLPKTIGGDVTGVHTEHVTISYLDLCFQALLQPTSVFAKIWASGSALNPRFSGSSGLLRVFRVRPSLGYSSKS